eukprot:TRINITY_DN10028_c0_g1_i1.p1 TRINITY_DN10028_c0_g1~~TRINITY_DN10028_c0_g1_i1.p1  ORF type:complete len:386 (+),score=161.89 TRINITY_DN10028_c0_g1_i1:90-1160(+)
MAGSAARSTASPPSSVDQFGFYVAGAAAGRGLDEAQQRRREAKWAKMRSKWGRMGHSQLERVKERVRKGIPVAARGFAWPLLLGSIKVRQKHADVYPLLVSREDRVRERDREQIAKDLDRTLPEHQLFRGADSGGQERMRRVLEAYSVFDPDVGYVQGMAFVVSMLLVAGMEEEDCFWALVQLMHDPLYAMRRLYLKDFPMWWQFCYVMDSLLREHLPKLAAHLERGNVRAEVYSMQWFLTLFIYQFPSQPLLLLRTLDIFFNEGWKIIFRVALALFKLEEDRLLQQPADEVLPRLKHLQKDKEADEVLSTALGISLKRDAIFEKLEQYRRAHNLVPEGHLYPVLEVMRSAGRAHS